MPREEVKCHYCKRELAPAEVTRDHVVPRALGGRDERWNVVSACKTCNIAKADRYPTCSCNFCRRARRRHWQEHGINQDNPGKRVK